MTGPWSRNAAAIRVSSGEAGAWRAVRAGSSGSARRAASAPQDEAPITGASSARAAAVGRRSRRLSPIDLADGTGADGGQLAPQVLGDGEEEPLDHLGRARELGAQVLALGGDPRRARVEVALAGHVAPDRHERRGPEGELLGAQERGDQQVTTRLQAAVRAQRDPVAQVVAQQDLVDLGEAQLPRRADVLDRRQRRRPGPAGVARQVDVRRAGLGHARRDRADTAVRDELDPDPRGRVDRAQVGDELGEVLDRVDVVVRRRADVALAGLAAPEGGDVGRRLAPGELAALAGLGALRDLDLELVGAGEVRAPSRRSGPRRPA